MLGSEQFFDSFDGQALYNVGIFTPAIVTPAGITLSVFVAYNAGTWFEDCLAGVVLRGDQDDAFPLALIF